MAEKKDLLAQTSTELKATVESALSSLATTREELGDMLSLTKEDRKAQGRFRKGEPEALEVVLDVVVSNPTPFNVLGKSDGGVDPETFEVEYLRDRLHAASLLGKLADAFEEVARDIRDTQLQIGAGVRGPMLAAYEIAKLLARHDAKTKSLLAKTIDFYAFEKRKKAAE